MLLCHLGSSSRTCLPSHCTLLWPLPISHPLPPGNKTLCGALSPSPCIYSLGSFSRFSSSALNQLRAELWHIVNVHSDLSVWLPSCLSKFIGKLWGLNEIMPGNLLAQCLAYNRWSVNVGFSHPWTSSSSLPWSWPQYLVLTDFCPQGKDMLPYSSLSHWFVCSPSYLIHSVWLSISI